MSVTTAPRPREGREDPESGPRRADGTALPASGWLAIAVFLAGFWGAVGYLVWSLVA